MLSLAHCQPNRYTESQMKFLRTLSQNGVSPKQFLSFLGFLILSMGILAGSLLLRGNQENRSRAFIQDTYTCTTPDESISVELTATHSETTGVNSVTATGGISKPAGFYYDVLANLYRYRCTCPDTNTYTCSECSSSYVQVTNSGGTSTTTTWDNTNSEFPGASSCATLQSDVTLGGVVLRDPTNGHTFSVNCEPHAAGISISEVVNYVCAPSPTPTVPVPTRTPTPSPTPTPVSEPTLPPISCARCDLDQDGFVEHTTPTTDDLDFMTSCLNQSANSAPCNRANLYPGGTLIDTSDMSRFNSACKSVYANNVACSPVTPTPTPAVTSAWWQSFSGLVGATTGIRSMLPAGYNLVTSALSGIINSAGIPLNNSGAIILGSGGPSSHGNLKQVVGQSVNFCQQYSIAKLMAMSGADQIAPDTNGSIQSYGDFFNPLHSFDSGEYHVYRHVGDLELTPQSTWGVTGSKVIIFNEGQVRIQNSSGLSQLITVDKSAFFGIFSTGSIIVDSSVGQHPPQSGAALTPALTGLYYSNDPAHASGKFIVESTNDPTTENQFVGSGTFVGCGGVELNRSFEDSVNATYSAENFFYNPALVNNFPTILQDSHVVWSEGV